jgi:quercetin dioxygenase-like cupin family protein
VTGLNTAHDLGSAALAADPVVPDGPGTTSRPAGDMPWMPTGRDGISVKVLRVAAERGGTFTLLRMDRDSTTGLHTHLAPASSYFLSGQLLDFQGLAVAGELGVNPSGTTHDALAIEESILVSRLDGPVHGIPLTPEMRGDDRDDALTPVRTDVLGPPDIQVRVESRPWEATAFPGVLRRTLWQDGPNVAVSTLRLAPGAEVPDHLHYRPLEVYVLDGAVRDGVAEYTAGEYAYTGAGTRRALRSTDGCELLCWADGPAVFRPGVTERLYLPPVPPD